MVSVLVFRGDFPDRDGWMAHILDYDIMAEGEDIGDALDRVSSLMAGELKLRADGTMEPLSESTKAPKFYWEAYKIAEKLQRKLPATSLTPEIESDCRIAVY